MLVKITLMSFHHFFRFKVGCIWGDLGCKSPNRLELGKNDIFLGKKSFLDHESRAGINRSNEGLLPFTTIIDLELPPHPGCQSPPGWWTIFRIGNPELNLYLWLLLGGGGRSKLLPPRSLTARQWERIVFQPRLIRGEPLNFGYLAILCDLFGMVKWPFSKAKWPSTRG